MERFEMEEKIREAKKNVKAMTCDLAFEEGANWAMINLILPQVNVTKSACSWCGNNFDSINNNCVCDVCKDKINKINE